jgi:hypothetical protein
MNIKERKVAKNSIPADALISLSFKTRMLNPSTFSPNCMSLFILLFFTKLKKGDAENIPCMHTRIAVLNSDCYVSSKLNNGKGAL